ncbi:MAG: hypothetical protein JRI50_09120 [Deltaproteobacteria bacterium]|nr:hypothetical protein [Deltaproteobacteria bacterium]MBW2135656.1 hypothetical protein [Deltaproteobacteria bacterium]
MNDQTILTPTLDSSTLKQVDIFLENCYSQSIEAGKELAKVGLKKSQINGLQTLVNSTRRFSEIFNFIKSQAGKERAKKEQWRKVADRLLSQLEALEQQAHQLGKGDPGKTLDIKLRLARGWAKQVVAHYLWARKDKDDDDDDR